MQILTDLFYIVLYVSVIGSIFTAALLFISRILRCALPLWFPLGGMILYVFPFPSPDVFLIPRETQVWAEGFRAVSVIWGCGCIFFFIRDWIRLVLAGRAEKLPDLQGSATDRDRNPVRRNGRTEEKTSAVLEQPG